MSSTPFLSSYPAEWGTGRSDFYAIIPLLSLLCPFYECPSKCPTSFFNWPIAGQLWDILSEGGRVRFGIGIRYIYANEMVRMSRSSSQSQSRRGTLDTQPGLSCWLVGCLQEMLWRQTLTSWRMQWQLQDGQQNWQRLSHPEEQCGKLS